MSQVSSSKRIFAKQYVQSGIPFYRQKEIIEIENGNEISEPLFISEDLYENIKRDFGVPQKGELLITGVGVTLGIPHIIGDEKFYFKDGNLIWCKNFDRDVNSKYVYYWIKSDAGQKAIWSRTIGSAQPALTIDLVKQYELEVPEIDIQNKVVRILSLYDDLIENNQKQIKLLEEAAQRLYKEWFVDFRFPGHEDVEIVDGIPKGWREQPIDDVFSIKYGKTLPTSKISSAGKYPVYGANGIIGYYSEKNCDDYKVLITSRGNGSGDVLRTYDRESFVTNNSFVVTPVDEDMPFVFIHQLMKATDFKTICTGSAQPQLTNNSISTLQIVVPTKTIVCQYGEMTAPMYKKIESINYQIRNLSEARDRLLPKLMSGEIEVGHDESEC